MISIFITLLLALVLALNVAALTYVRRNPPGAAARRDALQLAMRVLGAHDTGTQIPRDVLKKADDIVRKAMGPR